MKLLLGFLITKILFACTIVVDYPACYFLKDYSRLGNKLIFWFERNDFYGNCPLVKKGIPVEILENDVVEVYLEGKLYKVYRGKELCS